MADQTVQGELRHIKRYYSHKSVLSICFVLQSSHFSFVNWLSILCLCYDQQVIKLNTFACPNTNIKSSCIILYIIIYFPVDPCLVRFNWPLYYYDEIRVSNPTFFGQNFFFGQNNLAFSYMTISVIHL